MNILFVHNYYQHQGGEDISYEVDSALLESHGHRVIRYTVHNDRIRKINSIALALATCWNPSTYRDLHHLIRRERVSVIILKNTLPLISPAAYYAANALKVPVVQYLSNYRLLCPNALLFRDGRICEDCLGKPLAWPGIIHSCYRNSHTATATVAFMLLFHMLLRTWQTRVNTYIAMTDFTKSKFIQGGLPPNKIVIKPNFFRLGSLARGRRRDNALFVGRLSTEKGVTTLLSAWEQVPPDRKLRIVGDGPLADEVARASRQSTNIEWLGSQSQETIWTLMQESRLLVVPSLWYESFPRVIVEAFAAGLPVIGSDLGSIASIIQDNRTGMLFPPGNSKILAEQVSLLMESPGDLARIRKNIREEYTACYTPERNYEIFTRLIQDSLGQAGIRD